MESNNLYNAAVYLRLSKEDGDVTDGSKQFSDSISNQKDLIMNFLKFHKEIQVYKEYIDDGYSGVNFDRPQFQQMLADIRSGAVNCVVVKDLSRFGRNYIEAGRYIEKIFPMLKVRFIAITDNYDSIEKQDDYGGEMIIPFKNLVNDMYCRDISVKVRSNLEIKRKSGQYIGAFVVYGYLKDEEDHNRIVPDEYAKEVVRDIFVMKMAGVSIQKIADKLNADGILSPYEYKKSIGIHLRTDFKKHAVSLWSYNAVQRILKNEIYTGVLIQGKQTTPNYKVKTRVMKDENEWIRIENSHEPIIERSEFELVRQLMERDTRVSPHSDGLYLFSGVVFCGECGSPMVRKTIPSGKKKYIYYVCSGHNKDKRQCSPHRIPENVLTETVLESVKKHIDNVIDLSETVKMIEKAPYMKADVVKYDERIKKKREELAKAEKRKLCLYDDYKDNLINRKEYEQLKQQYEKRVKEAEQAIESFEQDKKMILDGKSALFGWTDHFLQNQNIAELDRRTVNILIDYVSVVDAKRIDIRYKFNDEYQAMESYVAAYQQAEDKEAV